MYRDDGYYLAQLEDNILNTVEKYVRLNVPRPFGILVSGGFDSGLLAAITKPDFVYTLRFKEGVTFDESRYADAVIDHLHLRNKTIVLELTKEDFIANAPEAIKAMGEVVSHFSVVPFYTVMKFISEHTKGLGVLPNVLSGEGPDEYLGGYARQIIFSELQGLYKIPELRGYKETINKVIGRDLVKQYGDMMKYDPQRVLDYQIAYASGEYPLQGAIGKMDMELGVIEKMEQKLAKHTGVNLHYPYINNDFAEYCYKLPDHLKIRNGVTKWAFRQIAKKYLPEFMMDRAKMGGPVAPVNKWLFDKEGFDKADWIAFQKNILNEKQ